MSIADATVDFTAEPLSSAAVFLITGNTGTGKSTILDSICLALFNNAPRLQRLQEAGSTAKSEAMDYGYTDPLNMARRDAAEASVELTFIGNDGIEYTAFWETHRPHSKMGKPYGKVSHTLTFAERSNECALKGKQAQERIREAIGLDFKKFCRTTMLAQGEFTRFLQASDNEKSQILEKITGTDIYREISKKIYAEHKTRQDAAESLQQQLQNVELLSDDELKLLNEKHRRIENEIIGLRKLLKQTDALILWTTQESDLATQHTVNQEKFNAAKTKAESDEIRNKEALIEQYDSTAEPRLWHTEIIRAKQQQETANLDIEELTAHALDIRGGLEFLRNKINKQDVTARKLAEEISLLTPYENLFSQAAAIDSKLKTLVANRGLLKELSTKISTEECNISGQLQKTLNEADKGLKAATAEAKSLETTYKDLQVSLSAKQPGMIHETLARLNAEKLKIERRNRVVQIQKELEAHQLELASLVVAISETTKKRNQAKATYDRERESTGKVMSQLRSRLTAGCTCPLCRQIVENIPIEKEVVQLIERYELALNGAEEELARQTARANVLKAEINVRQKSIASEPTDLNEPIRTLEEVIREIESVTRLINEIDALSREVETIGKSLDAARKKVDCATSKVAEAQAAIADAKTKKAALDGQFEQVETTVRNLENEIIAQTESSPIDFSPLKKPAEYGSALLKASESYSKAVDMSGKLCAAIEQGWEQYRRNVQMFDELQLPSETTSPPIEIKNLDADITRLTARMAATRQTLSNAKTAQTEAEAKIAKFLKDSKISDFVLNDLIATSVEEIAQARRSVAAAREELTAAKNALDDVKKRRQSHLAAKPTQAEAQSIEELQLAKSNLDEQTETLNRRIGEISQRLQKDTDNRTAFASQQLRLQELTSQAERWAKLNDLFGSADGKAFVTIAQTYVLMDLIASANRYMSTLSDRYRLRVQPNSFVIYVDDAYDGGSSRPANTISGGESFLVSLALALALSDIADNLQVDTLFIDEGFGTLSGQPLRDAITTLSQLHSQTGRHVGIISHVEELRQEIPTQIQLHQTPNSTTSSLRISTGF